MARLEMLLGAADQEALVSHVEENLVRKDG